jgi:hypothetical protein
MSFRLVKVQVKALSTGKFEPAVITKVEAEGSIQVNQYDWDLTLPCGQSMFVLRRFALRCVACVASRYLVFVWFDPNNINRCFLSLALVVPDI